MWPQNRDSKFRAKSLCSRLYGIRLGSMLSTDFQMISKWTARTLWQIYLLHSKKRSFLKEGRRIKNDLWFISTIAQFTRVGLQQSGSKNMACAACHSHPIHLICPPVTSTYFLQWKRNSNGLRSLTKTSFWIPASDFEGYRSGRIEEGISGLGTTSSRSKWRSWRLRLMINKFYL
jgi:hypothetical protein